MYVKRKWMEPSTFLSLLSDWLRGRSSTSQSPEQGDGVRREVLDGVSVGVNEWRDGRRQVSE